MKNNRNEVVFYCVANGNKIPCHHVNDDRVCVDCPDPTLAMSNKKHPTKTSGVYLLYGQPYTPPLVTTTSSTTNTSIGIPEG